MIRSLVRGTKWVVFLGCLAVPGRYKRLFLLAILHLQSLCKCREHAAEEEDLKSKITIAVLMLAAAICTSANAATILVSFNGSNYTAIYNGVSYNLVATAVDCPSATTCTGASGATTPGVTDTANGLGITGNPNKEIADFDYIVLDFSAVKTAVTAANGTNVGVEIGLYQTANGLSSANIIGTNSAPVPSSGTSYQPTGPGVTPSIASNAGTTTTVSLNTASNNNKLLGDYTLTESTGIYQYYVVDVTTNGGGCGVLIASTYSPVPEPGTFLMAGMALIGLGFTMKKRSRRV